jgi:hypothetical protein
MEFKEFQMAKKNQEKLAKYGVFEKILKWSFR